MPDAIPLFYSYKSHVPNLGIRSIAGNLSIKGVEIKYLDLIFFFKDISGIVKRAVYDFKPDLIGISAMTFQYDTLLKVIEIIKSIDKEIKIAIGGYHATVLYDQISLKDKLVLDYIIRGEGERTFRKLIEALLGQDKDLTHIKNLSFKKNGEFIHNEKDELLNLDELKLPNRSLHLFNFPKQAFGGRVETVETSRGCTSGCIFCSISNMYGRNFRKYKVERVINDIKAAKESGANRIIFADDNITLDIKHFEKICNGIIEAGLNDLYYTAQCASRGLAASQDLVKKMRGANFGIVFLGIENITKDKLESLGKGDIVNDTIKAISYLRKYDIGIMGGFILGNPDDDSNSIRACFRFAKKVKVDLLMAQYLTPYPKTILRERLLNTGLVEFENNYSRYNGFHPIAKTRHLSLQELEKNVVRLNIIWYLGEIFNPKNWFVKSRRVLRHVYLQLAIMTFAMIIDFVRGKYGKSFHRM